MFKNKTNKKLLNNRKINTRLHDAPVLFATLKPDCEQFKGNVYYSGSVAWNSLPVHIRNIETNDCFKDRQLLIRGVWEWFHQIGTGSLFLDSILLLCKL